MEHVQQRDEPRDLYYREDGPLGPTSKPAPGPYLLGALVLCLDFWLLCVLAVRWLT